MCYFYILIIIVLHIMIISCCIPTKPSEDVSIPLKPATTKPQFKTTKTPKATSTLATTKSIFSTTTISTTTTTENKCQQCRADSLEQTPKDGYEIYTEIEHTEDTDDGCKTLGVLCILSLDCLSTIYLVDKDGVYYETNTGHVAAKYLYCDDNGEWRFDPKIDVYVEPI